MTDADGTHHSRLERRIDRLEENVSEKFDRMNDRLDRIAEGQLEARGTASGLERAFAEIGQLQTRLTPLERDAPFVQMLTDSLRGILKGIVRGSFIIGAAILVAQIYPFMPWVRQAPLPVEIKAPAPEKRLP